MAQKIGNSFAALKRYIDLDLAGQRLKLGSSRSEPPQPDAEDGRNDECYPAYYHWNLVTAHLHRDLIDQSDDMTDGKEAEKDARDT